jgi:uncharacterized C2H2 Zn-finger protein
MEQRLRRAVFDRLEMLGDQAGHAEPGRLASLARTEIRRLTDGWRDLLAIHQPDDDGRCPRCWGWFRRRRWPCQVWLSAHQHLIGESVAHKQRMSPATNRRNQTVVIPRQLPAAQRSALPAAAVVAVAGPGNADDGEPRIHRAAVRERSPRLSPPRARAVG